MNLAVLAGVSKYESPDEFSLEDSSYEEKGKPSPFEGDYKAGEAPTVGDLKSELMGLAVFSGGKMVGELDGEESSHYLMVTGDYNYSFITIQDPQSETNFILLSTRLSQKPFQKVDIVDGNPLITSRVYLEADIVAIQSGINYEKSENISILERAAEEQIKQGIIRLFKKTAEEMNCDIFNFGRSIKHRFLTWEEWEKFGWLNRYKDASFDVEVALKVRRPGLMIRTIPETSAERKDMS